ncbi:zinc finger CCCH domain-containing protein 7A-like isoform X1 [Megalops cyprinoides]|uniref:zinc finger CCCH domain-containing protein 7A-like isoform X1 n=1 Tax=Megalops cyprinoides TaxID=118141 RepID=UPI00186452FA|nr:zinc finger CCCH domain-containing protein 7A-like isoform X1 [Megalops cyprinoides]XP_036390607.1 zinc finger CCCH domain-containing protein 7A-like isoform X1 [Megalops cyprinoides]
MSLSEERSSRLKDIQEGLQFIQSTLPFSGTQEQYEVFIQDLVRNLFGEGNDLYKEGEWARSIELYTEALNITDYADSEGITLLSETIEKLYGNRAAAYLNIGVPDEALKDCEKALQLNEKNHRALFRKARSLKEMGRHKEAYEAVAKCSLAVPQDESVMKLTQELARTLGLKVRKAYVRSQPVLNALPGARNSVVFSEKGPEGSDSVEDIELVPSHIQQMDSPLPGSGGAACLSANEMVERDSTPVRQTISFSVSSTESHYPESLAMAGHVLANGAESSGSYPLPESRLDCDAEIIGDDLDELLDREAPPQSLEDIPTMKSLIPTSTVTNDSIPNPMVMSDSAQHHLLQSSYHQTELSRFSSLDVDSLHSPLDTLDSVLFSDAETAGNPGYSQLPYVSMLSSSSPQESPGYMDLTALNQTHPVNLTGNPLANTHEFKQACSACFVKSGPGLFDYILHTEEHKCKKDTLVGRIKHLQDQKWKPIRPRPTKNDYAGPYYICKEVLLGEECSYHGHCTFAYCQEEIDVWTLERKGFINRDLICDPLGNGGKINYTIPKILQEHHGIFMFLCEVCFDHKPRIISKVNTDNPSFCSHPVTKHVFKEKKCLIYILRETTVRYTKIRPYHPQCQMELCRHELTYGCVREDDCFFAHSLIELKVWMVQQETSICHERIVKESRKYRMAASSQGVQQAPGLHNKFGPPHLKMQFVCGQCWSNGQAVGPEKNRKYCTAKARHLWTKDRRVVRVYSTEEKKWVPVRPLPAKKPMPFQFEICIHVAAGKKCQYIGNCSFAHSPEERDLWQYMKDKNIPDMEKLYELWLQSQRSDWSEEASNSAMREDGKQIHMPTDYAEEGQSGKHCWLCGKNCNSDKQWQQHISSEKHKDKVFNSEDDQNCWQYRFPTGIFKVCERFLKGTCTEEENCKLAHGNEELKEWEDRRKFLLMKLAKAKKDHLIDPDDNDFGKYSFLLKDIN